MIARAVCQPIATVNQFLVSQGYRLRISQLNAVTAMPSSALNANADHRRSVRHPVDHPVLAEHAVVGDLKLKIMNISPEGFMAVGASGIARGERLTLRLPVIGRIEAHLAWQADERAGFRFERLIRLADFTRLLMELGESGSGASKACRTSLAEPLMPHRNIPA